MKKLYLLLSLIGIVCLSLLYYLIQTSSRKIDAKYGNQINYGFKTINKDFIEKLNLETIHLHFSQETKIHFDSLYALVNEGNHELYQERNNWKIATLTYQNRVVQLKVKLHGRTPVNHEFNEFRSYAIKSRIPINNQRRFNLIIYERIGPSADRISSLAKEFDLVAQPNELIQLKINQSEKHLYYFETPIKNEFLSTLGWYNLELGDLKSPILNNTTTLSELNLLTKDKISQDVKLKKDQSRIVNTYKSFNSLIARQKSDSIHVYFDLDYIARFQVARATAGLTNHGFSPENLVFALDTNALLFYPILHRDNYFGTLSPRKFNQYEDGESLRLLELITQNPTISNRTTHYIKTHRNRINNFSEITRKTDSIHDQIYH
jgi:hypothetical protein